MQDIHIGPLPPPIGGISVYLYRLSKIKTEDLFIDSKKIIGNKVWIMKTIFDFKIKNFIIHSNDLKIRLMFYLLSLISFHNYSLVIHSISIIEQFNNSNCLTKLLIRKMLEKARFIQIVNPYFSEFFNSIKIKNHDIFIKPAFLAPPLEEEEKIKQTYNNELKDFIKKRKPLIVSNAHFLEFYKNQDLYGLDMCIELTGLLIKDYPNLGFIFALANEKPNSDYFKKMKLNIKKLKIEKNFYFMTGQKVLWPIFKKTDLFIRATNTDGDSVSIREALFFQVPVVASNVTSRPKECYLFKVRNLKELYKVSQNVLKTITKKNHHLNKDK